MKYNTVFRNYQVNNHVKPNAIVTEDERHYYPTDEFFEILMNNGYWPYISNLPDSIYFYGQDVQLWINRSKQSALAWIGPKYLESMEDLATEIEIPEAIPGIAKVELVYIVCKRWSGGFIIPNTVKNIFIDKFSFEYDDSDLWGQHGGSIIIDKDNPFLHSEGYALYTKDKKTLLDFCCCDEYCPYVLIDGVETNRQYAFFGYKFFPNRLVVPSSMSKLDARCVEQMNLYPPISVDCKGPIKELNIPLDASADINNYIEDVDCVDRDKQNDCSLVFKAPVPDKSPAVEGCFFLTAAGAATNKYPRRKPWSRKIMVKGYDIESVSPITLKCYDEHIGCQVRLKDKHVECDSYYVYESADIVLNKLRQCGIADVPVV